MAENAVDRATPAGGAEPPLLLRMGPLLAVLTLGFLSVSIPLSVLALYVHDTLGFSPGLAGFAVGLLRGGSTI